MKKLILLLLALTTAAYAQDPNQSYLPKPTAQPVPVTTPNTTGEYTLAPFDQLVIAVGQFEPQFNNKVFRIDADGDVSLPIVGHVRAAGITAAALESSIRDRLSPILKNPDVSVNISENATQKVSILGAVKLPGIYNLSGKKNLFEALSLAGGLTETAGTHVTITRQERWGAIPLPSTQDDPAHKISVATVQLKEIATFGADSLTIMPGDTIFIPKADVVYAVGDLIKPGGFAIGETEYISALQVVSLAGGLVKTAASNKAKILRAIPGSTSRSEIPVDLKKLMAGKAPDIPLQPQDILFVPNSNAKSAGFRTIDAIVNAASSMGILAAKL